MTVVFLTSLVLAQGRGGGYRISDSVHIFGVANMPFLILLANSIEIIYETHVSLRTKKRNLSGIQPPRMRYVLTCCQLLGGLWWRRWGGSGNCLVASQYDLCQARMTDVLLPNLHGDGDVAQCTY